MYRAYPGPYQCFLSTGNGKSKNVKLLPERPTNVGFRHAIVEGMIIPGVSTETLKGRNNGLVWWEKEVDKEMSNKWRM